MTWEKDTAAPAPGQAITRPVGRELALAHVHAERGKDRGNERRARPMHSGDDDGGPFEAHRGRIAGAVMMSGCYQGPRGWASLTPESIYRCILSLTFVCTFSGTHVVHQFSPCSASTVSATRRRMLRSRQ